MRIFSILFAARRRQSAVHHRLRRRRLLRLRGLAPCGRRSGCADRGHCVAGPGRSYDADSGGRWPGATGPPSGCQLPATGPRFLAAPTPSLSARRQRRDDGCRGLCRTEASLGIASLALLIGGARFDQTFGRIYRGIGARLGRRLQPGRDFCRPSSRCKPGARHGGSLPLRVSRLLAGYGLGLGHRLSLVAATGILTCWLASLGWQGYGLLDNSSRVSTIWR